MLGVPCWVIGKSSMNCGGLCECEGSDNEVVIYQ